MKTKTWNRYNSLIIILAMLLIIPAFSFADEVGLFTKVAGRVDILKAGAGKVVPVKINDNVYMGDVIRTKSDGKVEITFKDKTIIALAPGSRVEINKYMYNLNNTRNTGILNLFRGKIRAFVSKTMKDIIPVAVGRSTFNINTPTAVTGVRGTEFIVSYDMGITGVIFKDGDGFAYNPNIPDKIVYISTGLETFIMNSDVPPSLPKPAAKVELLQHIEDTTIDEKSEEDGEKDKKPENDNMPSVIEKLATLMGHNQNLPEIEDKVLGFTPPPDISTDILLDKINKPDIVPPVTETNPETLKNTETEVKLNVGL